MKRFEIARLAMPAFAERLRELDDGDLGNGTPIADAVATVLSIDMASKGAKFVSAAAAHVAAMDDATLIGLIDGFRQCLALRNSSKLTVPLPFGGLMQPSWQPGVKLGNNHYAPLRGIPGLHERNTEGLPHRPGQALLLAEIVKALSTLPACDVPPPTVDEITVEHNWRWRDTIKVPMRGGPGRTYIHSDNITITEIMLDIDIAAAVAEIRELSLTNIKQRDEVDREFGKVLAEIYPLLEKAKRQETPLEFAGVKVHNSHGTTTVRPQFNVLGHDLKPATWDAWINTTITKAVEGQLTTQRRRKRILDEVGGMDARGRVDDVTLRAIRALTDDPAALLRRIARERNVTIQAGRNGKRSDPVRLAWRDGRVESCFAITDKASWNYKRLIFKGVELPEAVLITLKGKPVSALVEHPFLEGGHTIRSVTGNSRGGWIYANLDITWTFFDADTGETFDADADAAVATDISEPGPTDDEVRQGDLVEMLG